MKPQYQCLEHRIGGETAIDIFPRPGNGSVRLTGEQAETLARNLRLAEAQYQAYRLQLIEAEYQKQKYAS